MAALPRSMVVNDRDVPLPHPLAIADALRYRRVFAMQDRAEWGAADRVIASLRDRQLVGHVLAHRYLHARYKTSFAELATWLAVYPDHPDAVQIHRLAESRRPKGTRPLKRPAVDSLGSGAWTGDEVIMVPDPGSAAVRADARRGVVSAPVKIQIRAELRGGDLANAELLLDVHDTASTLSQAEADQLRARIASGHLAGRNDETAYRLAASAAERSGESVPRAHWVAGLAAWRQSRLDAARQHFEALATRPNATSAEAAAGAFWAARVHLRLNRMRSVNQWLSKAAEHPRSFYGLLARRIQGLPSGFNWDLPPLAQADVDRLLRSGGGARAFALVQVGETERAEAELRRLYPAEGAVAARTFLAIALRAKMPGLAMRLARDLTDAGGRRYDAAVFPMGPWEPQDGYEVDRALIFALMRQESAFDTRASSPAGAKGLMQLMPPTAAAMAGTGRRIEPDDLLDPETNVTLGQRYIKHLLTHDAVRGDLIRLAAAYNGGPGNLARWWRDIEARGGDDALVFIESLPSSETRQFIARVLYNYWIYSERLGLPVPSLESLARGEWPAYIALDDLATRPLQNAKAR